MSINMMKCTIHKWGVISPSNGVTPAPALSESWLHSIACRHTGSIAPLMWWPCQQNLHPKLSQKCKSQLVWKFENKICQGRNFSNSEIKTQDAGKDQRDQLVWPSEERGWQSSALAGQWDWWNQIHHASWTRDCPSTFTGSASTDHLLRRGGQQSSPEQHIVLLSVVLSAQQKQLHLQTLSQK